MICKNCNAMNEEGSLICTTCGVSLAEKPKNNKKLFMILGIVAVVVIAVVLVLALGRNHGFDTPEEAAVAFVEGSRGGDADLAKEAIYPDYIDDEVEKMLDRLQKHIGENGEENYGFKAVKSTGMPNLWEKVEDFYGEKNVNVTVDDVEVVEVNYKTKGESSTTTLTVFVAKIDGKWYAAFAQ